MTRIGRLGSQILAAQSAIGLDNPTYLDSGLARDEQAGYGFLRGAFADTELADLFAWRNGTKSDVAMSHLWIIPGFFFLSAKEVQDENAYFATHVEGWRPQWYPLLSEGTADRLYVNQEAIRGKQVPVFYAFWESPVPQGQMYDGIESMMETILRCYQRGVYFLDADGMLSRHLSDEAEIARSCNPNSDYWRRVDLTK